MVLDGGSGNFWHGGPACQLIRGNHWFAACMGLGEKYTTHCLKVHEVLVRTAANSFRAAIIKWEQTSHSQSINQSINQSKFLFHISTIKYNKSRLIIVGKGKLKCSTYNTLSPFITYS